MTSWNDISMRYVTRTISSFNTLQTDSMVRETDKLPEHYFQGSTLCPVRAAAVSSPCTRW